MTVSLKSTSRFGLVTAVALALSAPVMTSPGLAMASAENAAPSEERPGHLRIQGTGSSYGTPDIATVSLGVESEGKTARAALTENTENMNRVFRSLKQAGLEDRDIQTSNFSVNPRYKTYPRGESGPLVIIGYTVNNSVTAHVRDIDNLGAVLDAVVSEGANRLNGLDFSFSEPGKMADEARKAAVADALRKARQIADEADVRLGRITDISESGGPRPMMGRARVAAMEAAPVPIAAGEGSMDVTVNMTIEIHPK